MSKAAWIRRRFWSARSACLRSPAARAGAADDGHRAVADGGGDWSDCSPRATWAGHPRRPSRQSVSPSCCRSSAASPSASGCTGCRSCAGRSIRSSPPTTRFPHFAFYPLLIVIFGLGALPLIVLATLFAMVAMIVATLAGLDRVPRVLLKTARVHRLSPFEEMWRIRLPAAAPHLFSGIKLAVAYSFIGVIAGEFIMSTDGRRPRDRLRLRQFRQSAHVRPDPVRAGRRHHLQHAGLRLRAAAPGGGGRQHDPLRSFRDPILVALSLRGDLAGAAPARGRYRRSRRRRRPWPISGR